MTQHVAALDRGQTLICMIALLATCGCVCDLLLMLLASFRAHFLTTCC